MAPVLAPELGDLIEIFRGFYQHWAIYVGDGYVVHFTSQSEGSGLQSSSMMSSASEQAIVKREKLSTVVGTDEWSINNDLDMKYEPRQSHIIVREACEWVGQERKYNVVSENCEHFVNELRYGKAESQQVSRAAEVVGRVLIFGVVAVVGFAVIVTKAFVGAVARPERSRR